MLFKLITIASIAVNLCFSETKIGCPSNWKQFRNKCYIMQSSALDYDRSEEICRNMDAELLSIHSKEERDFILSTFRFKTVFLAAKLIEGTKLWVWPDMKLVTYFNWLPGEPNNVNNGEPCIEMFGSEHILTGFWNDRPCTFEPNRVDVVCLKSVSVDTCKQQIDEIRNNQQMEKQLIDRKLIQLQESVDSKVNNVINKIVVNAKMALQECNGTDGKIIDKKRAVSGLSKKPSEFNLCFNRSDSITKCYNIVNYKLTFEKAVEYCKQHYSKLVSIDDENENQFIEINTLYRSMYWIGTQRVIIRTNYFANIDGTDFRYSNWAPREPKSNRDANCVSYMHGQWFAKSCDSQFKFICESYDINRMGTSLLDHYTQSITNLKITLRTNSEKIERIEKMLLQLSQMNAIDSST